MSFFGCGTRIALAISFVFFLGRLGASFRFSLSGLPLLDLYEQRLRNLNSSASDYVNDVEWVATHLPCGCAISGCPISSIEDGSNFRGVLVSRRYLSRSE